MEKEFEGTSVGKLVLRLGIPAMLAQFFNILYSVVDRTFVGHIPGDGELALAGIGICAPVLTAITAFTSLAGTGGASAMSICMGKKRRAEAEQIMDQSLSLLLFFSAVITILGLLLEKPLLYRLGCSDAMYPFASRYFRICLTGTAAVLCGTGMNQFILAWGNARRGMFAIMIGAIVNTILDPVFIYLFDMGIEGAALATVIAQFCVLAYVLSFLFSDKALFRVRPVRPDLSLIRRILGIGCLPFLIMLFDNLLVIALNAVLRRYGGDVLGDQYISCAAVVQSFMILVFYPAQGITVGCGTLYSYFYGAGQRQKVIRVFQYVFLLCAAYMLLLCAAAQWIPRFFAGIFVQEESLIRLSAACIQKYTLGLLGVAVQYAVVDGLTAMGQIRLAMPVSFFRKFLYLGCVFLLPAFFSPESTFYAETISDLAGAAVTAVVFFKVIVPKLLQE